MCRLGIRCSKHRLRRSCVSLQIGQNVTRRQDPPAVGDAKTSPAGAPKCKESLQSAGRWTCALPLATPHGKESAVMIPSAKEVEHARELLSRYLRPTPLASAESLAQRSGARVYLKIESDLPTRSFKPRGALNALLTTAAQSARCEELLPPEPVITAPLLPTLRASQKLAPRFFFRKIRTR